MTPDAAPETLQVMEVLLTAEVFNTTPQLDANDLNPLCRRIFGVGQGVDQVKRPVVVPEAVLREVLKITGSIDKVKQHPFVEQEALGKRLRISALEPAARWFLSHGGKPRISGNPALSWFFEHFDSASADYRAAREANPRIEDTRPYLDARVSRAIAEDESLRSSMELLIVSAPEEVEQALPRLVITDGQRRVIAKIRAAMEHRDYLISRQILEVGKLLFIGPPGTGKTSLALALSRELHLPVLEVRLSMITSQYLGETSKNIDRIFQFARKLAPCILFIDEFDFVAKSRITDDHGAMKRAVNMLLKNIDRVNLVRDRVLLIGATNHPQLLDEAAWRRFDEVVEFPLPDEAMRREILVSVTSSLECKGDLSALAGRTEGFSGADLRVLVREALLSALVRGDRSIGEADLESGIRLVQGRNHLRGTE
ncbi:MAG: ATP-binding protein [Methanomicrobiales archaeon]|nr:ATP-binding protein [Methanomicrobiales archaeon]